MNLINVLAIRHYLPDSSISEDVSWDNYQQPMKLAHGYGVYNGA
jgi:hypothetical protein